MSNNYQQQLRKLIAAIYEDGSVSNNLAALAVQIEESLNEPEVFYGPELPAKLEQARALLNRTAEVCCENPPDKEWFRDYFLFTGDHMILVDECWEPGSSKEQLRKDYDDPEWEPDDEVNAPAELTRTQSGREGKEK